MFGSTVLQRGSAVCRTISRHPRQLHMSARLYKQPENSNKPTHQSRISPAKNTSEIHHPGYTDATTPVTDAHPSQMPAANPALKPASQSSAASTQAGVQHPGVHEMAEGGKHAGQDAISVEDRNVKNWAANQRSPEFNEEEGKRRPILDGGSNEGGFDSSGKSRT